MSRCDVCLRHVDIDLVCPHDDDRRLCSDCCGCDPEIKRLGGLVAQLCNVPGDHRDLVLGDPPQRWSKE